MCAAAAHEGDDNTPSSPTGRGVKREKITVLYYLFQYAFRLVFKELFPEVDHIIRNA